MNIKFFQVGGCVRDTFIGVPSKDIDFAVEAPSFDAMREAIIAKGGKIFLETPKFLTIRAMVPKLGSADYVLCRKDGDYTDGRRPDSVTIGTILDDLARRDFTMNAIALDVENETVPIDPFDGLRDIADKIIRCVGDAKQRFAEDKLRVFRSVRFSVTKGFTIHSYTANCMSEVNDFSGVSTERIREELVKMFKVDSFKSFRILDNEFPNLGRVVQERGLWFKPTSESV